jgi:hypothetical protein
MIPDDRDILQSRSDLAADDGTEIERFHGTGERLTKEGSVTGAFYLHRRQRALH